eukprot:13924094-Heterocapsa_arctica.AAC.1
MRPLGRDTTDAGSSLAAEVVRVAQVRHRHLRPGNLLATVGHYPDAVENGPRQRGRSNSENLRKS